MHVFFQISTIVIPAITSFPRKVKVLKQNLVTVSLMGHALMNSTSTPVSVTEDGLALIVILVCQNMHYA